jgi:YesN/AraC family two-component response regulator
MKPKVLIVDDHEIVREGIRRLLTRSRPDWNVCGEATSGREAIAAVKKFDAQRRNSRYHDAGDEWA